MQERFHMNEHWQFVLSGNIADAQKNITAFGPLFQAHVPSVLHVLSASHQLGL
jgi:hypothetical protein